VSQVSRALPFLLSSSMASKSGASGKEKLIDEEQEILQAVVLADSWNKRFRPLTTKKPRVGRSVELIDRMSNSPFSVSCRSAMRLFSTGRSSRSHLRESRKSSLSAVHTLNRSKRPSSTLLFLPPPNHLGPLTLHSPTLPPCVTALQELEMVQAWLRDEDRAYHDGERDLFRRRRNAGRVYARAGHG